MSKTHLLRAAAPRDVNAIAGLIRELAEFEKLPHQVEPQALALQLFGHPPGGRPAVECVVGEVGGEVVAFALFFATFSTFLCKPGLYLEDLYVQPAHRGSGLGKALLTLLGRLAAERGCGRFEWSVLDWNQAAIGFYEKLGATVLPDWRICRIAGDRLAALAK